MLALAIETSCDETSLAFVEYQHGSTFVDRVKSIVEIDSIVSSQIDVHAQYGGVVPEIGARLHAEQIHYLMRVLVQRILGIDVMDKKISQQEIDYLKKIDEIYVTTEPGLPMALQVGKEFAQSLASIICSTDRLYEVNHLRGHVASSFWSNKELLDDDLFPHLHYLVSGGNTQMIYFKSWNDWKIIGQTLDDAAGESLDKIGRMMGLPYPAAPKMARIVGDNHSNLLGFPIPMKEKARLDVSNSGLKTYVRNYIEQKTDIEFEKPLSNKEIERLVAGENLSSTEQMIVDICTSAHFVVMDQLDRKFQSGIKQVHPASIGMSGGVSASKRLREIFKSYNLPLYIPELRLTGDNAVMIAVAGILS